MLDRRHALTLLGGSAAAVALAACGGGSDTDTDSGTETAAAGSGELTTVRVGHLPSALFTPLYVADAKGFFADAGIELELIAIKSGQDGVPMLANDQMDVMVAGFSAGMLNALNEGLEFKIVGSMGISPGDPEASPTVLEVSKALFDDGTITSVADLAGHPIGGAGGPGATGGYLLASMLATEGLTLADVEVVNLSTPDQEAAIANGSVVAAVPSAPFSTAMEEAGTAVPLAVPAEGVTGTGVVFSESFQTSELAQPFFTALTQGAQELTTDGSQQSDEVYQIIADVTGQDLDVLKATPMYGYLPDLAPQPEQLANMQTAWAEGGLLSYEEPIDPATVVDTTFAENASA